MSDSAPCCGAPMAGRMCWPPGLAVPPDVPHESGADEVTIVHGACPSGADQMASEFCESEAEWFDGMGRQLAEEAEAERDAARLIVEELQALRDSMYGQLDSAVAERDALQAAITAAMVELQKHHKTDHAHRLLDPNCTVCRIGLVLSRELPTRRDSREEIGWAVRATAAEAAIERVREVRDQWALTSASPDDSPDSRLRTQLYADVVAWLDAALDAPEATTERTDLIGAYATHLHVAGDRTDAAEAVIERIHRAIVDVYGEDYDGEDVAAEVERLLAYLSEHGANVRRILQAKNEAIERAQATIDRVRGVHVVNDLGECVDCRASWPCPTIAVLDAPETPGDAETEDRWRHDEQKIDGGFSGCEYPRLWPPRRHDAPETLEAEETHVDRHGREWDPHPFVKSSRVGDNVAVCVCGQSPEHQIHAPETSGDAE